jgi:Flp pilus assembly protein TadD/Holliday junction resolvase-like predicted endonuclease
MKSHSRLSLGKALVGLMLAIAAGFGHARSAIDTGRERAALVFQILASEMALAQGEIGIAAVTYLSVAKQTQDPAAAKRATELAIEARLPERAQEAAQIWLASAPGDREAQTTLDLLQVMMGETEKLMHSLAPRRDLADKEGRLGDFYDYVAGLAGRASDRQQALRLFESISRPHASMTAVMYTRAMLYERAGQEAEMIKLLRELIAREPSHAHAHNALGYHFADKNIQLGEALSLIEKALALAPNDAHIIDSMGWVQFRLGNLELAEKYLRKAHAKQPDAEISTHLGEVLWVKGQKVEAQSYLQAAFAADPRNEVLLETLKRLGIPPLQVHPR